jgi:glycosyltransferase involved in cell wall biosynthesis
MISRKLDRENLRMTAACLIKLPIAWRDFLRLYRSFRPDVIYLANYHEIILLWPLLLWLRRKVICHMHDPPPPIVFQKLACFFWRRAVGRFLFVSNDVGKRLGKLGASEIPSVVVHNGVQVEPLNFPRRRHERFCEMFGWPSHCVIFGLTGQLDSHKGHEDFIDSAFLAKHSNPRMRFVIGGRGPDQYVAQLRQRIAARGMEKCVGFSGWLSRSSEFYEGIDVFVLASRHEEGFGLVVAEAGERGLPSIATRSGGAVEVVMDGETGILVNRNDPQDMAQAMNRLGADEELRKWMGRHARERITKEFDLAAQAERFASLLAESASDA